MDLHGVEPLQLTGPVFSLILRDVCTYLSDGEKAAKFTQTGLGWREKRMRVMQNKGEDKWSDVCGGKESPETLQLQTFLRLWLLSTAQLLDLLRPSASCMFHSWRRAFPEIELTSFFGDLRGPPPKSRVEEERRKRTKDFLFHCCSCSVRCLSSDRWSLGFKVQVVRIIY